MGNGNEQREISPQDKLKLLLSEFDSMPGFEMTAAKLSLALDQCRIEARMLERREAHNDHIN